MNWKSDGFVNGNTLKIFACLAMLLDHIGYALVQDPSSDLYTWFCLVLGRMAFPIFAFLLAEGLYYTHDRKKYILRMLLFALISEIPFDMVNDGRLFDPTGQNVYFTLALGLIACICIEKIEEKMEHHYALLFFLECACVLVFAATAQLFHFDYGAFGIVAIYLCHVFRKQPVVAGFAASIPMIGIGPGEAAAIFSPCILIFYNGKRGKLNLKYAFYLFYPVHMLIIGLIRIFVVKG